MLKTTLAIQQDLRLKKLEMKHAKHMAELEVFSSIGKTILVNPITEIIVAFVIIDTLQDHYLFGRNWGKLWNGPQGELMKTAIAAGVGIQQLAPVVKDVLPTISSFISPIKMPTSFAPG